MSAPERCFLRCLACAFLPNTYSLPFNSRTCYELQTARIGLNVAWPLAHSAQRLGSQKCSYARHGKTASGLITDNQRIVNQDLSGWLGHLFQKFALNQCLKCSLDLFAIQRGFLVTCPHQNSPNQSSLRGIAKWWIRLRRCQSSAEPTAHHQSTQFCCQFARHNSGPLQ